MQINTKHVMPVNNIFFRHLLFFLKDLIEFLETKIEIQDMNITSFENRKNKLCCNIQMQLKIIEYFIKAKKKGKKK